MSQALEDRITYDPQLCGERLCIRSMRIGVSDILYMLAEGVSQSQIRTDFPDLEAAGIAACLK
jgi:uncharacterized protein (DUF433 family)